MFSERCYGTFKSGKSIGIDPKILTSVIDVNENQPKVIVIRIIEDLHKKNILILGLAFKPDTDDIRESVSIKLIEKLKGKVMSITAHDPIAMNNTKSYFGSEIKINYFENWKSCVKNIDIVIIATTWSEYKDLAKFDDIINGKVILDAL